MQKLITNTLKIMIHIKNRHNFNIGLWINLYGWASQKLRVNYFK